MTEADMTNQLRVLYIEDDVMTQTELGRYLKKRLGKLYCVNSCEEALKILETEKLDLIITDLRMPGMNGLQLIERLRTQGNPIPVIVTSAFSDSETILLAVDLGIVKYVVKPIAVDSLMKAIVDISVLMMKQRGAMFFNERLITDRESRLALETQIKRELAHTVKILSGKGPKDLSVFLKQDVLEVQIIEGLTAIEIQLLKFNTHHSLLCAFRRAFYETVALDLCQPITAILGTKAQLMQIQIDLNGNRDTLVFQLT